MVIRKRDSVSPRRSFSEDGCSASVNTTARQGQSFIWACDYSQARAALPPEGGHDLAPSKDLAVSLLVLPRKLSNRNWSPSLSLWGVSARTSILADDGC